MTKREQQKFVKDLCNSIKEEITSKIEADKIPENWDGWELRELLKIKFEREAYMSKNQKTKRYKDFYYDYLVNNL